MTDWTDAQLSVRPGDDSVTMSAKFAEQLRRQQLREALEERARREAAEALARQEAARQAAELERAREAELKGKVSTPIALMPSGVGNDVLIARSGVAKGLRRPFHVPERRHTGLWSLREIGDCVCPIGRAWFGLRGVSEGQGEMRPCWSASRAVRETGQGGGCEGR
jgi:hypothetical protein